MVLNTGERFPKSHRLRKRQEYLYVQNHGHRFLSRFFLGLVILRNDDQPTHLGITTTKRYANAVVRNRTRRLIREAFRKNIIKLPIGADVVIIPKKFVPTVDTATIFKDLASLGSKISIFAEGRQ